MHNYHKGAYLKPFANQRTSSIEPASKTLTNDGDRLGLQPQIHKRFLSMSNGIDAFAASKTIPKTTTNSFAAERGPLDMSLNSIQYNSVIRQKQNIESAWNKPTNPAHIATATLVDPADFLAKR